MKFVSSCISLLVVMFSFIIPVSAQDKATPQEVFKIVLSAVDVLQNLKEKGLPAFNDPKGEFVYKDTYVYVMNCETGILLATPDHPEFIGQNILGMQDPNGVFLIKELCRVASNPNGGWVEYLWKPDAAKTASRKICFAIKIPETQYTALAGIHDDKMTIEQLEKIGTE